MTFLSRLKRVFQWFIQLRNFVKVFFASLTVYYLQLTYITIPNTLEFTVKEWAETAGIELTVGEWSVDWIDAKVSTNDFTIIDPNGHKPIAEAPSVSLDFSIFTLIKTRDLRKSIYELRIDRPIVRLERNLVGRWNWESAINMNDFADAALLPDNDSRMIEEPQNDYPVTYAFIDKRPPNNSAG